MHFVMYAAHLLLIALYIVINVNLMFVIYVKMQKSQIKVIKNEKTVYFLNHVYIFILINMEK